MSSDAWLPSFAPTADGDAPWTAKWLGRIELSADPKAAHPPALISEALFHDADTMGVFAVLDAALLTNLPEWLSEAGIAHDCLFDGDAREELGSSGPWLVELQHDSALLRLLFTEPAQNPQGWGQDAGVFFRSSLDFAALRAHLRRFTRLRRPDDSWVYFRFWQPEILGALCLRGPMEFVAPLLPADSIGQLLLVTEAHLLSVTPHAVDAGHMTAPLLTPDVEAALGRYVSSRFRHRLCGRLSDESGLARDKTEAVLRHILGLGFRSRAVVTALAEWWCTPDGARTLSQDWAAQELADSSAMPDQVRLDRLRNLAAEMETERKRPGNAAG